MPQSNQVTLDPAMTNVDLDGYLNNVRVTTQPVTATQTFTLGADASFSATPAAYYAPYTTVSVRDGYSLGQGTPLPSNNTICGASAADLAVWSNDTILDQNGNIANLANIVDDTGADVQVNDIRVWALVQTTAADGTEVAITDANMRVAFFQYISGVITEVTIPAGTYFTTLPVNVALGYGLDFAAGNLMDSGLQTAVTGARLVTFKITSEFTASEAMVFSTGQSSAGAGASIRTVQGTQGDIALPTSEADFLIANALDFYVANSLGLKIPTSVSPPQGQTHIKWAGTDLIEFSMPLWVNTELYVYEPA